MEVEQKDAGCAGREQQLVNIGNPSTIAVALLRLVRSLYGKRRTKNESFAICINMLCIEGARLAQS